MRCFSLFRNGRSAAVSGRVAAARVVGLAIALSLAGAAWARSPLPPGESKPGSTVPDKPHTGELRALDESGKPAYPLPLRHTDVDAQVSGNVARVTVEQRFENPYDQSLEVVYTFPLPHEAAVNDLEIRIGDRIVRGQVRRRQEAREIYEQAKRDGRVAALLDQERPNIFTQRVANVMPGHAIVVRIRYIEELQYGDGAYELVFPTVVGPRFIPGSALDSGTTITPAGHRPRNAGAGADVGRGSDARSGHGWAPDTDRVPDASRITPPVLPHGVRSGHDIDITVQLDAGVALQRVHSENHAVDVKRNGRSRASVALRSTDTIPNKDFILRWGVAGRGPEFGWLTFRDPSQSPDGYFSLLLQPEAHVSAGDARPKEMIFLIDASGSMSGEPMAKVKSAMRWALQHLNPEDTFQIIRFSERASGLSSRPLVNTPRNVERGLAYIEQLRGQGGTHMRAGIEAALSSTADPERLRLVFFMTDGYIGNENEILSTVRTLIGDARLFAFGIGSSVNRFLLDRVAEEGRGVVDYVSLEADTRQVVERFYERVAKPYLTDIEIDWGDLEVSDLVPARVPDLFAGQPLVISGRYKDSARGTITVRGKLGRRDFERHLRVQLPKRDTRNEEVATFWARRRIGDLMSRMVAGENEEVVRSVTELALRFQLMSAYTSFVAVDNQVVNAGGQPMLVPQPVPMPAGVSHEGVFGARAAPGRGRMMKLSVGASSGAGGVVSACDVAAPRTPLASAHEELDARAKAPAEFREYQGVARDKKEPHSRTPTILPSGPGWEFTARAMQQRVAAGEEVRVEVTLHNRGTSVLEVPVSLDPRDGSALARVTLDGALVPAPRRWRRSPPATLRLAPGASHTWVVALSGPGRYAFAVAGTYTVELRLADVAGTRAQCTIEVE